MPAERVHGVLKRGTQDSRLCFQTGAHVADCEKRESWATSAGLGGEAL